MRLNKPTPLRPQRGVAIIEFALTLGFLLLVTVGITEIGRAFWYYSAIQKSAREGARCLSMIKWEATTSARTAAGNCVLMVIDDANAAAVSPALAAGNVEIMVEDVASTPGAWGTGSAPDYVGIHVAHDMRWLWRIGETLPAPGEDVNSQIYATMPLMNR